MKKTDVDFITALEQLQEDTVYLGEIKRRLLASQNTVFQLHSDVILRSGIF
jgi:hypothetical protein